MDRTPDRIANPWGARTPYAPGEPWPVRTDLHLADGVTEEDVEILESYLFGNTPTTVVYD